MRRIVYLFGALAWFLFGIGFVLLLVQYVGEICGWEIFGLAISSGSALLGMAHIIGLFWGMVLCFAAGLLFYAHAVVPPDQERAEK